jgi:FKBP-type peptidyl-prolyl cis-trans isomerase
MKRFFFIVIVLVGAEMYCGAEGIAEVLRTAREKADMSYAFGMFVAADLRDIGLEFNYGEFTRGFREIIEGGETQFTMDEAEEIIQAVFDNLRARENEEYLLEAEKNRALGNAFLAQNALRPGVLVTASGLQFELLSEGDGEIPVIDNVVLVHYQGTTIDGFEFDSTYEDGYPIEIPLDQVIPGWSEGLRMMREGSRAKLYVPPDLAYGERGMFGVIQPNAVLIFEVELLEIIR